MFKLSKTHWSVIYFILFLIFISSQIFLKEKIKTEGEVFYYMLAPVDPRAFMLGDYMELRYTPAEIHPAGLTPILITLDENKVVTEYQRLEKGMPVLENQRLLHVRKTIRPERFYFQEGHAEAYNKGEYGIFRYLSPDEFLLEGLADENLKKIVP